MANRGACIVRTLKLLNQLENIHFEKDARSIIAQKNNNRVSLRQLRVHAFTHAQALLRRLLRHCGFRDMKKWLSLKESLTYVDGCREPSFNEENKKSFIYFHLFITVLIYESNKLTKGAERLLDFNFLNNKTSRTKTTRILWTYRCKLKLKRRFVLL